MAERQEGFVGSDPLIREKLVRDGIPDSLSRKARKALDSRELASFLAAKVVEEASELAEQILHVAEGGVSDGVLLEMADLLEILDRVRSVFSLSANQVEEIRREKLRIRGGFETDRVLAVPSPIRRLANGTDVPLRSSLLVELARCRRADLAVAFIREGAAASLLPALREALSRGARIRILTTDYLGVTDPEALDLLLSMREKEHVGEIEIRCFLSSPAGEIFRGYHPKAYIFERENGRRIAFVGSSNLSNAALSGNVEWNVFLREIDLADPVDQISREFGTIFSASRSALVDHEFVRVYRERRKTPSWGSGLSGITDESTSPCPNPLQNEVLLSLAELRADGARRALAILATGLGKTYLAAFDCRGFFRVLFLAHRREILDQARETFLRVHPEKTASVVGEGEADVSGDLVFAQVQTLARSSRLLDIPPDTFDYIVVDECHHAEAPSYQRILGHFRPKFVLGLTATPYRMDNGDIFALMDGHVACRRTFIEGIREGMLVPFHYFGIKDIVDYEEIPWRGSRYDPEALERALTESRRAQETLRAFREHEGSKTVAFCISRLHARLLAEFFFREGIAAGYLTGETTSGERQATLRKFREGALAILFVVDLLNEGVDIPKIDRVMLLRPTDSPTVFLQQIGRGLRLAPGKSHLTILDFIGNHRRAHYVLPALTGREPKNGNWAEEAGSILRQYKQERLDLPPGVTVTFDWEAIDLLEARILSSEPRETALLSSYAALWETLGHRPTLLETALEGEVHPREALQFFGSWQKMLENLEKRRPDLIILREDDRQLFSVAGDFFREVERTAMSRSYKMVVLSVWLEREGGLSRPISLRDLSAGFRSFFADPLYRKDLEGTEISDLDHVTERTLESYVQRNPVSAWAGRNRKGERESFFQYDNPSRTLSFLGKGADLPGFREALQERVSYRLSDYFQRRVGVGSPRNPD